MVATLLFRSRNAFVLAVVAVALSACSSTRLAKCDAPSPVVPPRNFGQVTSEDGRPILIYRGGQPVTCGELQYLESLGIRSVLKLNDRDLPIDAAEEQQVFSLGMQIKSFAFKGATIGRGGTCDSVREALEFLQNRDNWPVYVHCTAGKDRTGYLVGMYEKLVLGKSIAAVFKELHGYGHSGLRSVMMGQIDRELARDAPACAP